MQKVIGITGGIASGKSTVSNWLKSHGYIVVDADIAARKVVEKGEEALAQIVQTFGDGVLLKDGTLNRAKLGTIIFNDASKREKLNQIVHPAVRAWMEKQKEAAFATGESLVFLDIPLLFESKLEHMCNQIILVYTDKETQIQRLMSRNDFTMEEARARIRSQMPLDDKKAMADFIIDNNGSINQTILQLQKVLNNFQIK